MFSEPRIHTEFALDAVCGDGTHFHLVAFGQQVFDDIGSGRGGVQDDVLALADRGISQLGGPLAGVAMGLARPGVGVLLTQAMGLGMEAT
ncbi:hypothetical protein D9M69_717130 [compost metagenome]